MFKKIIRNILAFISTNTVAYKTIANPIKKVYAIINENRLIFLLQQQYIKDKKIQSVDKNIMFVTDGLFEGMQLVSQNMYAGVVLPTLTGCYESELNPIFHKIIQKKYQHIVDIGCAEGYYAVGLALKMPNTVIYAYDIEKIAQQECIKNATINGVKDRVIVNGFFSPDDFKNLSAQKSQLIFTDCEGYEKELFTTETVKYLTNIDVLVEVHDFVDATISQQLKTVFANTHDCEIVSYIPDKERFLNYKYPLIEALHLPATDKYQMYAENRWPQFTEWYFFTAKNSQ